jgi:hypothetical protein
MRYLVLVLMLCLMASTAWGKPSTIVSPTTDAFTVTITFAAGDTADSDIIPGAGRCAMSFIQGGSDTVTVYQVPTATTAAASGTAVYTFTATTEAAIQVTPAQEGLKVVGDGASGGSKLIIRCSNTQIGTSGGGPISIASEAEIEGTLRSLDKTISDTLPHQVHIVLADEFVNDPTATTPLTFNLPVGGAEQPRYVIDLGGHFINRRVDPTVAGDWEGCAVLVNLGNVNGTCGGTAGYYEGTEGCQGVSHDYDVIVTNGTINNDIDTCDAFGASSCGRKGLCVNNERLRTGTSGAKYGGRAYVFGVKFGAQSETAGGSAASQPFSFVDDRAIKVGVDTTSLILDDGIQFDAAGAVLIEPDVDGDDSSTVHIHADGPRYFNTSTIDDEGGFYDIQVDSNVLTSEQPLTLTGEIKLIYGSLGNILGGAFALETIGTYRTGDANCYSSSDRDWFLDAGFDATQGVTGYIRRVGNFCTRGLMRSGSYNSFSFYDHIPDIGVALFGSLATDTDITGSGANRFPIFSVQDDVNGTVDSAYYELQIGDGSNFADIADYGDLADNDVVDGTGMQDAESHYTLNFGPFGYIEYRGTTPDVYQTTVGQSVFTSGNLVPTRDSGTSITLTPRDINGTMLELSDSGAGAVTITLPLAASLPVGATKCFMDVAGTGIISLSPNSADNFILDGVSAANDEDIDSPGGIGDYICIYVTDSTTWRTLGRSGTWVEETP